AMVVLVPEEVLRRTPSREHGIRRASERELRGFGAVLIQQASVLLRLPQTTCVSAVAIYQRFFFRRSFADFDARMAAAAAVLLASKVEETHRRLRDVVVVFHRLHMRSVIEGGKPAYAGRPTPATDPAGLDMLEMKQAIMAVERHMLQELGFAVSALLEHPHKYVLQFVKSLKRSTDFVLCELAQTSWNYLNDSMRTSLCCEYQPHQIATAAIFLAARKLGLKLPHNPPWWAVFDTEHEVMCRIARVICGLYRRPPPQFIHAQRRPLQFQSSPPPGTGCDTPGTPGLLRSPSDEGPGGVGSVGRFCMPSFSAGDGALDPARIAELLREDQASPRSRSRSRSPKPAAAKKRVVKLVVTRTR
ncbi:unnamed protein product, partial [Polarella glacialis]